MDSNPETNTCMTTYWNSLNWSPSFFTSRAISDLEIQMAATFLTSVTSRRLYVGATKVYFELCLTPHFSNLNVITSSAKQPSLEDSARFVYRPSYFHFFEFRNNNSFTEQGPSALRPTPNLKDHVTVFTHVPQLYPHAPGSLFDSQGYGGGILTRLHTEKNYSKGVYLNSIRF
jgi:hypothetical protein